MTKASANMGKNQEQLSLRELLLFIRRYRAEHLLISPLDSASDGFIGLAQAARNSL